MGRNICRKWGDDVAKFQHLTIAHACLSANVLVIAKHFGDDAGGAGMFALSADTSEIISYTRVCPDD
jgi:hypothetical protein